MDLVCECIPPGSSVFDLGCGTGVLLLELIAKRGVRQVGGCETSSSLLLAARTAVTGKLGAVGQFSESAEPLDCIANFDCITLIDVLHHIPKGEQAAYISRVASTMKPSAKFIIKDIDAASPLVWFNRLHDAVFSGNGFQEIACRDAKQLTERAGLICEHISFIRRIWYPHYLIVARKAEA
jgi:2-polyprenyl-3-methyl-5-hydroxy-6-metoxy-1,4-benzoquinol methylase